MPVFETERFVAVPVARAWAVVADVVGYADAAPNLTRAVIEAGEGLGMRRRCWDTAGRTWTEQCVLYEEGRRYAMAVDSADYPFPMRAMEGTWSVEPAGSGTLIRMRFEYEPQGGALGRLAMRALRPQFRRLTETLFDNWATQMGVGS